MLPNPLLERQSDPMGRVIAFLRRFWNRGVRALYYLVYVSLAAVIYVSLGHFLGGGEHARLATVCATVLAVLFAFSALLYNRGRALPPGATQTRSLYAAERGMQASILFMLATAVGGIGAVVMFARPELGRLSGSPVILVLAYGCYLLAILLSLAAFASFFFALQAVAGKAASVQSINAVVRRVRSRRGL